MLVNSSLFGWSEYAHQLQSSWVECGEDVDSLLKVYWHVIVRVDHGQGR